MPLLRACHGKFADNAEVEVANATGHSLKTTGSRAREPVTKWDDLLAKRPPAFEEHPLLAKYLEATWLLRDIVLELRRIATNRITTHTLCVGACARKVAALSP